ncbi:MAG: sugar porter family MFS transporter [Muribaculaceae bacterium]|nr:sugar porter family MFS transporter [Muribaculaceae bacterium]
MASGNTSNFNSSAKYNVATMPLTGRHIWIVTVASLGQLIGTAVTTIVGVIIPMLNIILHPELSGFMQGLLGAVDLIGICIGAIVFGRLSDKYGYLLFFRLCPALVFIASTIAIFAADVAALTVCLFFVGFGIGGEYSLDSDYVSELMPDRYKALMVGITKTASSLGNIIAAAICFGLLMYWKDAEFWPRLMWIISIIAGVMILLRIRFYQSPGWLMSKGRTEEAEIAVRKFLGNNVEITAETPATSSAPAPVKMGLFSFVAKNWKKVMLSGVPWACEGLGVYGIGVFLPILVMALGLEHFIPGQPEIFHIADSVKITLYISAIMFPGFVLGLWLIRKRLNIASIQTWGFLLCTLCLAVLMPAYTLHWNKWIAIGAFMGFELFLNMGPHLITYVLPPKIYDVEERGQGVGIAAAVGKIGAVLAVFIIPILLHAGGAMLVLGVSAGVMAVGALITFSFRHTLKE